MMSKGYFKLMLSVLGVVSSYGSDVPTLDDVLVLALDKPDEPELDVEEFLLGYSGFP